jgi:hypothetical protein
LKVIRPTRKATVKKKHSSYPAERSPENQLRERAAKAEIEILEAIHSGDLVKVKSIQINPRPIDSRLGQGADTVVSSSQSGEIHIGQLVQPTCLVYSILCEQAYFVEFLLTKLSPDM